MFSHEKYKHLYIPAALVTILLIICALRAPQLFTSVGLAGAILVSAPLILASIAITPIAMAGRGGVDLSIGPAIGFVNVTIVTFLVGLELQSPLAVFSYAIVVGCIWQLLLAAMIVFLRVSPILVSLSGFLILQGVNLTILPRPGGFAPDWLSDWGYGTELNSPVLYVLLSAFLLWYLFCRTPLYESMRLLGSDERTAYTSGVKINLVRFSAHIVAGIYTGLAAVCLTGLIGSGDPSQGNTYTLQAITALVLGGTSLAGGNGGALGSILGALAMFLIFVVLSSFNFGAISGFMTELTYGLILVVSLLLTIFTGRIVWEKNS